MTEPTRRNALVTGAGNGIGAEVARRLDAKGHRLLLTDIDGNALRQVAASLQGEAVCVTVDICADDAPVRLRQAAEDAFGAVQILVNNAGIAPKSRGRSFDLAGTDDSLWDRVLDVNLRSMFRLCREFVPAMAGHGWGRVINISSLGGRTKSLVAGPAYMASKAAILGLTRSVASEFSARGVTANAVAPGRIETRLAAATSAETTEKYLAQIPVGRFGTATEVAAAVAYLASEEAGFVTGAVLDINGGFFMS